MKERDGERPRLWARLLKTTGLDSRGMKAGLEGVGAVRVVLSFCAIFVLTSKL